MNISEADVWISDFDDTIASGLEREALLSFTKLAYLRRPGYYWWILKSVYNFFKPGRKERIGRHFLDVYINTDRLIDYHLVPGVQEFYDMFPDTSKVIVTRNCERAIRQITDNLGIDYVITENNQPNLDLREFKRIAIFGDSDRELEWAKMFRSNGYEVITIGINNPDYDVNVKDYFELMEQFT